MRAIRNMRSGYCTLLCWAVGFCLITASAGAAGQARHTVIAVIDGPRSTEFLEQPGRPHAPVLDSVLMPQGTYVVDFVNDRWTNTNPGHTSILTGIAENVSNDATQFPANPTLFELVRKSHASGPGDAWIVAGKDRLQALTHSTHPDYGPSYQAQFEGFLRPDSATINKALEVMGADSPRILLVGLSRTDLAAHGNDWNDYLTSLAVADSLLGVLWAAIEADPVLGGSTNLFISADHGRHDDPSGGFQNHGDACSGCRELPFMALGPDIRSGHTSVFPGRLQDIAATVVFLMGVSAGPPMEGTVMTDILTAGTAGVPDEAPAVPFPLVASPNPFSTRTVIRIPSAAGDRLNLDVFGLNGHRVLHHRLGAVDRWTWNGQGGDGRPVPGGVYWVRVQNSTGSIWSGQLVKVVWSRPL